METVAFRGRTTFSNLAGKRLQRICVALHNRVRDVASESLIGNKSCKIKFFRSCE